MSRSRVGASLVAGALALMAVGVPTAAAGGAPTTRYVDVDGQASAAGCSATTAAFSTIQSAVAVASDGDRILVCPAPTRNRSTSRRPRLTCSSSPGHPSAPAS